jgi:DNA-binding MarR family transcriptional regulator
MSTRLQEPVSMTKLAALTVTERTTITRNLTILEKKGLVRIEQGSDRREREVVLSEMGREALLAAIPLWETAQAHIENGLGKDGMEKLLKALSQIVSLTRSGNVTNT